MTVTNIKESKHYVRRLYTIGRGFVDMPVIRIYLIPLQHSAFTS